MAGRKRALLAEYLEGVSWRLLEEYPDIVRQLLRRRTGIYALYKAERLYYVGLASNMRGRIKQHLKDRHEGRWDRFNVYLTPSNDHMKDLETIVLRIAKPTANRVSGKPSGAANLARRLVSLMKEHDADRRARLVGGHLVRQRRRTKTAREKGSLSLAGLVDRRMPLRANYKGRTYRATLRKDGRISFQGRLYESPSEPAIRVAKRAMNGWWFWHYKEGREWVRLDRLRN